MKVVGAAICRPFFIAISFLWRADDIRPYNVAVKLMML